MKIILKPPDYEKILGDRNEWNEQGQKSHEKLKKKYDKNHKCYICDKECVKEIGKSIFLNTISPLDGHHIKVS